MRSNENSASAHPGDSLATLAATVFAAVFMVAMIMMVPGFAIASETASIPARASPGPDFRAQLDDFDEFATLDAVHAALSQVGDGGTYVWHRHNGRISAIMQVKQSFKDTTGQVCRSLVVMLNSGQHSRKTETVACRLATGGWQLDD